MLFQQDIEIPANRVEANPVIMTLPIAKGIITKMMVRPRPGHSALAHLVILHHQHQIAPSSGIPVGTSDFHGDTFPIDWEEYYESNQPPYELKLKGWNDDDTHPHTFSVYVAVLPRKAIIAYAVADAIKSIFAILSPKRIFGGGK